MEEDTDMSWLLKACPACGGDLTNSEDPGWVACLMCGRSYRMHTADKSHADRMEGTGRLRRKKAPKAPMADVQRTAA
jgi:hypothetical protein